MDGALDVQPAFVGRTTELAAVTAFLDDIRLGHAGLLIVEAEAGAGKTRLLQQVLREAAAPAGFTVHAGEGDPHDSRPLRTVADALDCRLTSQDPTRVRIAELLRSPQAEGAVGSTGTVGAVQELVLDVVERAALRAPLLLVLDDLHWVDAASLALVGSLTRRLRGCCVGVLAATRPSPRVHQALDAAGPAMVRLGPLDDDELAALARSVGGASATSDVESLRAVRSNPFLVSLLAVSAGPAAATPPGTAPPGMAPPGLAPAGAPSSHDAFRRMTERLDGGLREFLELAALAGRELDIDLLAAALGERVATAVNRTREAERRGWLTTDGEAVRFRHDLLAEALVRALPVDRRDRLHLRLGRSLAALGHAPERAAYHLDAASYLLTRDDVATLRPVLLGMPGDDVVVLSLAQRAHELDPDDVDVLCVLMSCCTIHHRPAEAVRLAERWLAGPAARGEAVGRVRLHAATPMVSTVGADAVTASLEDVLRTELLTPVQRADAFNFITRLHWYRRDAEKVRISASEALEASRAAGSVRGEVHALCSRSEAESLLGALDDALRDANDALRLAATDPTPTTSPELALGTALATSGRMHEGLPLLTRNLLAAERAGDSPGMALAQVVMQGSRFHIGDWDAFVADADAMAEIGRETGLRTGVVLPLGFAVAVALRRGRFVDVPALMARLRSEHTMGDIHPGAIVGVGLGELAELEAGGSPAEACAYGAAFVTMLQSAGHSAQGLILMDVARLAWEVGDAAVLATAASLSAAAAALAPTPTRVALADGVAGLAADDADRVVDAARRLDASERVWDAATMLHIGGLLCHRARRSGAKELLDDAALRYERLGSQRWADVARAREGFAALVGGPAVTDRARTQVAELSAAERRVLELVAQGLANGDIADALFVSKRTVESHLASLYRKLGVSTRVALARVGSASSPASSPAGAR